ncbi:conserved hypothetical protein [Ricinus communis]|uniref:Uncharacterized protein n=1 Tax=Ricinus communis TaxID=3988 RepID=B9T3F9_RICCO|nr:conserved hypothetical protein [Ricinus communis]|eukprot:XP_002532778.1 transcription factor SPT20 homolog [Ricinus communis]
MEDHCSPLSLAYYYQDEGIEELRHCLLYITELEATIFSAKEEITRREFEIVNLKDLLNKAMKERNEAQEESQKLILEKLVLQQQLKKQQQQQQQQEQQLQEEMQQNLNQETPPPISGSPSREERDFNNHIATVASQFSDPIPQQKPLQSELPEAILKLAAARPLPEKGKLLQAVKEAGPLLQTLLLAGPLPQWQHPPPQLDSIEIPLITISSPANRLTHQDSFNSFSACLTRKRSLELCESSPDSSSSSPSNKYQKVALL